MSQSRLRRLYQADAQGIVDQDLIDDVGITLLLRCQAILDVDEARQGRVKCPRCARAASLSPAHDTCAHDTCARDTCARDACVGESCAPVYIQRKHTPGDARDEILTCPACGWQITWGEYYKSFKRKQLNSGGATQFFQEYVQRYPTARTPQRKMLAIDRLIHQFHYSYRKATDQPTRSVGPNLIQGKLGDVLRFLDELSYGPGSTAGLEATRHAWETEYAKNMRSMMGGAHVAEIMLPEIEDYLNQPFEDALAQMQADHAAQPDAFRWTKVRAALEVLLERDPKKGPDVWVEKLLAPHLPASMPDVHSFLTRIFETLYGQETGFFVHRSKTED